MDRGAQSDTTEGVSTHTSNTGVSVGADGSPDSASQRPFWLLTIFQQE